MQAEIRQVRHQLLAWGEMHGGPAIRSQCRIIASLLDLLSDDPTNLPLRQMAARNIATLAETAHLYPVAPMGNLGRIRRDVLWLSKNP
jgi:hypothetical protein